jgi:hypothetical protein
VWQKGEELRRAIVAGPPQAAQWCTRILQSSVIDGAKKLRAPSWIAPDECYDYRYYTDYPDERLSHRASILRKWVWDGSWNIYEMQRDWADFESNYLDDDVCPTTVDDLRNEDREQHHAYDLFWQDVLALPQLFIAV